MKKIEEQMRQVRKIGVSGEKKFEEYCKDHCWEAYKVTDLFQDKEKFGAVLSKLDLNQREIFETLLLETGKASYLIKGGTKEDRGGIATWMGFDDDEVAPTSFSWHLDSLIKNKEELPNALELFKKNKFASKALTVIEKNKKGICKMFNLSEFNLIFQVTLKGVPDYLVFDGKKVFFVEVKTNRVSLSKPQKEVISFMKQYFNVYIFVNKKPDNIFTLIDEKMLSPSTYEGSYLTELIKRKYKI